MTALFGEDNGFFGKRHSDDSRRRISKNRKGKGTCPKSPETRAKMSEAAKRRVRKVKTEVEHEATYIQDRELTRASSGYGRESLLAALRMFGKAE
jgi:hypothetical protein